MAADWNLGDLAELVRANEGLGKRISLGPPLPAPPMNSYGG